MRWTSDCPTPISAHWTPSTSQCPVSRKSKNGGKTEQPFAVTALVGTLDEFSRGDAGRQQRCLGCVCGHHGHLGQMSESSSWLRPPPGARLGSTAIAVAMVVAGSCAFAFATVLLHLGLTGWDEWLYHALNDVSPGLARLLSVFAHIFLPLGIVLVVATTTAYLLWHSRSVWPLGATVVSGLAAWLLSGLCKQVADRTRPYEVVAGAVLRQVPAHGTSFPSTHSAVVAAVVIVIVPFVPRLLGGVAVVYGVLVGWSRVFLGVHYPLDVLAGFALGVTVAGCVLLVLHRCRSAWLNPEGQPEGNC